jgi:hypothetical protein
MFLLATTGWAAPPPMAGPCCGRPPIGTREPVETDPELPGLPGGVRVSGGDAAVVEAVCRAHMRSCNLDCGATDPPEWAVGTPLRRPIELGDGRTAAVRRVVRGVTACWEEEWVLEVEAEGARNVAWLGVSGGGGTKGGSTSHVHRTAALGDGYLWVEIQVDDSDQPDHRHVVLWGVVVAARDLRVYGPVPLWVDGTDREGPAQIDVTYDAPHHVVITARTPVVSRDQQRWLGGWTLQ